MLGLDALKPAAFPCPSAPDFKLFQDFFHSSPSLTMTP
jgi:hypothetical protein